MLRFSSGFTRPFSRQAAKSIFFKSKAPHVIRFESTTTQTPPSAQYQAKKIPLLSPTMILLGIMPIFTFALGTWQVQRLKWKVNLIDELEEKLGRDPMLLPKHINLAAVPDFAYRKVLLTGKWDHAHTMLLGPRVLDGTAGYHVVTPLVREDGSTVLVNRGFITPEHAESKDWSREEGTVEVLGMLRTAEARNKFTPDNHPEKGEWYWADVSSMAAWVGGEAANVQPVFIDEVFEGHAGEAATRKSHGIPIGRAATVDVRNSHASYVATWYALSAFTTVMFARLLFKQSRARARLPR
ncbi:mitochondrial protein required for respiration [Abortiporus biennis]|nr:mitochondrial protein required for respiration [Abortiporus biennis]